METGYGWCQGSSRLLRAGRTCRALQSIAAHGYYEPIRSRSSSPNSSPNGGQLTVLSMS
jgi:hypothetical protein